MLLTSKVVENDPKLIISILLLKLIAQFFNKKTANGKDFWYVFLDPELEDAILRYFNKPS